MMQAWRVVKRRTGYMHRTCVYKLCITSQQSSSHVYTSSRKYVALTGYTFHTSGTEFVRYLYTVHVENKLMMMMMMMEYVMQIAFLDAFSVIIIIFVYWIAVKRQLNRANSDYGLKYTEIVDNIKN